jgi:hypothetical protein
MRVMAMKDSTELSQEVRDLRIGELEAVSV